MENDKKKVSFSYALLVIILFAVVCFLTCYIVIDRKLNENNGTVQDNNIVNDNNISNDLGGVKSSIKIDDSKDYVYDYVDDTFEEYKDSEYDYCDGQSIYTHDGFNTTICDNGKLKFSDLRAPFININSGSANIVNKSLKKLYSEYVEIYNKNKGAVGHPEFNILGGSQILTYYSFISHDVLSIVVVHGQQQTDILHPEYLVYNFDLETGNLMTYNELLDRLGVDYDVANNRVRDKILELDKEFGGYYVTSNGEKKSLNELSLNMFDESVIDGSVKAYVNNGKLEYLACIFVPSSLSHKYIRINID